MHTPYRYVSKITLYAAVLYSLVTMVTVVACVMGLYGTFKLLFLGGLESPQAILKTAYQWFFTAQYAIWESKFRVAALYAALSLSYLFIDLKTRTLSVLTFLVMIYALSPLHVARELFGIGNVDIRGLEYFVTCGAWIGAAFAAAWVFWRFGVIRNTTTDYYYVWEDEDGESPDLA